MDKYDWLELGVIAGGIVVAFCIMAFGLWIGGDWRP